MRICVPFSFSKVHTDQSIETKAKAQSRKASGDRSKWNPPFCMLLLVPRVNSILRALQVRSLQVLLPAHSRQLAEICLEMCGSSWEAIASTSATCQRNKAKASNKKGKGRAALESWRGYCETKGGHAYLDQHQSSQTDLQSAHLGSLEFCPTLNSRGSWACNQNRCPQSASTRSLVRRACTSTAPQQRVSVTAICGRCGGGTHGERSTPMFSSLQVEVTSASYRPCPAELTKLIWSEIHVKKC